MFKLIAIIDESHIIKEGLSALLRNGNVCQRIGSLENLKDWQVAFKNNEPDIVITNPAFFPKGERSRLKTMYHISDKPIFVGLVYQYFDRDTLAQFDETIYITDPADTILNKLLNLKRKNNDTTKILTVREKDILKLLLQGLSNKEVAGRLVISTHTVIAHRKNIIEKTGIRSLSGLAIYALLNNICDMEQISK